MRKVAAQVTAPTSVQRMENALPKATGVLPGQIVVIDCILGQAEDKAAGRKLRPVVPIVG